MRILHFDCFSGISGDMTVGALRDLGVEEAVFQEALAALGLNHEFHAHFRRDARQNISGWKFDVHAHSHGETGHSHSHEGASHHPHHHGPLADADFSTHLHGRSFREIRLLLEGSSLKDEVKERSIAVFRRIARAEGRIHGQDPEDVSFHEVGAVDSLADIVAACAGIEALNLDQITASPLVEGTGWINCAHGRFALPAPATLEILSGLPLRQIDEPVEFITPTGAALLAEFASSFGPLPWMRTLQTGYGVGTRDTPPRPNVLRAILGEGTSVSEAEMDEIAQIETNLDDLTPELAGATMPRLLAAGALDVYFTPAQMKKNRPGFILTVLCAPASVNALTRIILTETTSFGVRIHHARRLKLRRDFRDAETPYGTIRIKLGFLGEDLVQAAPEYESCREAAERSGVSIKDVHLAAWIGTPPKPAN